MIHPDQAVIRALRRDLALQIARHVRRSGQTQAAAAGRLAIPQPTLSKVMRGDVEAISLELLLKVAVRAGLAVVLQTGNHPAEAGVYASNLAASRPERTKSRLSEQAHHAVNGSVRAMTPEQRLQAQLKHSELVTALHRAGVALRAAPVRSRG